MAGPVGELLRTDFSAPSTGHRAPSTLTGAVPMRTVSEPLSTKLPVLSTSHPGWGRGHGAATRANVSVNVGPSSQRRLRAHGYAPPPGGDASPERSPHADRRRAAQHQALSAASGPPWVGRAHGAATRANGSVKVRTEFSAPSASRQGAPSIASSWRGKPAPRGTASTDRSRPSQDRPPTVVRGHTRISCPPRRNASATWRGSKRSGQSRAPRAMMPP